tara:strand:- start:197 stop:667 length:471 start_codon:yes stop_codon:yes gene_type:complete
MGVSTSPTMSQFISEIRGYVRDFPELNRLISGEESSDRMVEYCTCLAIDEWNTTPPLSNVGISDFPSRFILLQLTLCHLLTSVGILKSRNRFAYSDGGFSVETEGQDDRYVRWIQLIRSQLEPKILRLKIAKNISEGYGASVGSEYGWIHGWYGLT